MFCVRSNHMYDIRVKLWTVLGLIRGFDRCACDLWMDGVYKGTD